MVPECPDDNRKTDPRPLARDSNEKLPSLDVMTLLSTMLIFLALASIVISAASLKTPKLSFIGYPGPLMTLVDLLAGCRQRADYEVERASH